MTSISSHAEVMPCTAGALLPEVRDLLHRSANVYRGLALLHRAPIECVAVTLGVHPAAVERVRAALESPGQRALAIEEFSRAVRQRGRPAPGDGDDGVLVYAG